MTPFQAKIFIYAETEEEVKAFQEAFHALVNDKREQGIAVTAGKLTDALQRFGNNFFVNNYLR
jgi:elongation factor P hydroxylase